MLKLLSKACFVAVIALAAAYSAPAAISAPLPPVCELDLEPDTCGSLVVCCCGTNLWCLNSWERCSDYCS